MLWLLPAVLPMVVFLTLPRSKTTFVISSTEWYVTQVNIYSGINNHLSFLQGFNDQEIVALAGAHALGRCHPDRSGFDGPWQEAPTVFSNEYFKAIAGRKWIKKTLQNGGWQWVDKSNPDVMMLPAEIAMYNDKEFKKYFDEYAADEQKFFKDFAAVYKKLLELGVPFKGDEKVYEFKRTTDE